MASWIWWGWDARRWPTRNLPCKVQSEQASDVQWCLTCNLCSELEMRGKPIGCAVYNKYFADLWKECRSEFGAPSQIVTGD